MKYLVVLFFSFSIWKLSEQVDCDTVCTDSCPLENEAQTQTGQCVCNTGYVRNPLNGRCECPPNEVAQSQPCTSCNVIWFGLGCKCPLNQMKCVCQPPNVRDFVNNICCPPNEIFQKGCGCICKPPLKRNESTKKCDCPPNEIFRNGICICVPPLVRDPVSKVCCGPNEVFNKDCGECICKKGFLYNAVTKKCECPWKEIDNGGVCVCPKDHVRNAITGLCMPLAVADPVPIDKSTS